VEVGWQRSLAVGDFSLDGGVVAGVAAVDAIELLALAAEPGFDSAKGVLGAGQMGALLRGPTCGCLMELALSVVLEVLAAVRNALTPVGSLVALVGEVFASISVGIAMGAVGVAPVGIRTLCLLGGAAFVCGVLALQFGGTFVVLLRLAVNGGGLAMEVGEGRVGLFDDEPFAAFGGGAFGTGLFAREVAQLLSSLGALTMLVGGSTGHGTDGIAPFPLRLRVESVKRVARVAASWVR
jgi:hypothetical protein